MAERKPIESWLTDMDGVLIHEGVPIPGADAFIGVLPSWIPPASAGGGNEAPAEQGRGSRFAAGRTGVHPLPALRHKLMG